MNKIVMSTFAVLLVVGLVAGSALAFPFGERKGNEDTTATRAQMEERRDQMEENRAKLDAAMEQGYDEWLSVVESLDPQPRMAEKVLDEEDFNTLVELREAQNRMGELRDELGLEKGPRGHGRGHCRGMAAEE